MKPKIRTGVFETNSSSTHSLCIAVGDLSIPKGDITIRGGEFGWEVESHYDFYSKASYLLTWCYNGSDREVDEPRVPDKLKTLKEVIEKHCGGEVTFEKMTDKWYPWGYIDHQSAGVAAEAFESEENLINFLFNPNSFVHTDNDNY